MHAHPLEDRVIVRRIAKPIPKSTVVLTDSRKADKQAIMCEGIVLACGPGKWVEGTWWSVPKVGYHQYPGLSVPVSEALDQPWEREWEWIPGYREQLDVQPGDKVLFNARWNDFAHDELKGTGADGTGPLERPLSYRFDPMVHLIQEADIAGRIG